MSKQTNSRAIKSMEEHMASNGIIPPEYLEFSGTIERWGDNNVFWATGRIAPYIIGNESVNCMRAIYGTWRKPDEKFEWTWPDGQQIDPLLAKQMEEDWLAEKQKHAAEKLNAHVVAAGKARQDWESFDPRPNPKKTHPSWQYLSKKGIDTDSWFGARCDTQGNLKIPMRDIDGDLMSLQTIFPDGSKRFLKGGQKKGCFHVIQKENPSDKPKRFKRDELVFICEGFATGASIHLATSRSVVVAFDAGNLRSVCKELVAAYPETEFVIAADNDQWGVSDNTGIIAAAQVADEFQLSSYTFPMFHGYDTSKDPTDFNDLHQLAGVEAVKRVLLGDDRESSEQTTGPGEVKTNPGHSNQLQGKSGPGREGSPEPTTGNPNSPASTTQAPFREARVRVGVEGPGAGDHTRGKPENRSTSPVETRARTSSAKTSCETKPSNAKGTGGPPQQQEVKGESNESSGSIQKRDQLTTSPERTHRLGDATHPERRVDNVSGKHIRNAGPDLGERTNNAGHEGPGKNPADPGQRRSTETENKTPQRLSGQPAGVGKGTVEPKPIKIGDIQAANQWVHKYSKWYKKEERDIFVYNRTHWELGAEEFTDFIQNQLEQELGSGATQSKVEAAWRAAKRRIVYIERGKSFHQPNPLLTNFTNGTLEVDPYKFTSHFRAHSPDDNIRNTLPLEYPTTPEARAVVNQPFLDTLDRLYGGDKDKDAKIELVKMMYGAMLCPNWPMIFLMKGDPDTGKSTLIKIAKNFVHADNYSNVDPSDMTPNNFLMEDMIGKIVNLKTDIETTTTLPDSTLKLIFDRVPVTINRKGIKQVKAHIPAIHVFATNGLPQFAEGGSGAQTKRWRVIEHNNIQATDDKDYDRKVFNASPQGILNFALDGRDLLLAKKGHYPESESGARVLKDWQLNSDDIGLFLEAIKAGDIGDENCRVIVAPKGKIRAKYLWEEFKSWRYLRNNVGQRKWYEEMQRRGFPMKMDNGFNSFSGLMLETGPGAKF